MAGAQKISAGAVACIILSAISLFLWILLLPSLASLTGSDPAGNAMAQAFTAIGLGALWLLLVIITLVSWFARATPKPAMVAALVLVPASGYAAFVAMDLLTRPGLPPHLLPLIIPAFAPPLIVAFALWAVLPPLRTAVPAPVAVGVVWGAVLLLSVAIVPLSQMRYRADAQETAQLEKAADDYARLPPDAGLAELVPFLATRNEIERRQVRERIRAVPARQSQAEAMLERGDFPLGYLGSFDLDPTPALCDKARAALRKRVEPLISKTPGKEPYGKVADEVSEALNALVWLVGFDCASDAELLAWETMANGYVGTNYDVIKLKELRDPKELGRRLREDPPRFAMLSPKSHLKAWLKFADDPALRAQALAGARAIDHRTADAVEILTDRYDEGGRWHTLKYLPVLELDATPQLCSAGLAQVRDTFGKTYKPKPDDPRPYDELLSRLGAGEPLTALLWLAGKGCAADAELAEAESFVRAYRPSPESAAMLAALAQVRRKP